MLIVLRFFESELLNRFNKIWIGIVAGLYFIVFLNTVYWYFFPYPELAMIFQELRPYSKIIMDLIIIFIVAPMILGFVVIKRAYNNELSTEIPIPVILLMSTPVPLVAFLNNCFTGNLLFSLILLVFGVVFTVLTFKFR